MKEEQNISLPSQNQKNTRTVTPKEKKTNETDPAKKVSERKKSPAVSKSAPPKKATRKQAAPRVELPSPSADDNLEEMLDEALPEEHVIEEIPVDEPEEAVAAPQRLSIFQRRQQQKRMQDEQQLPVFELIRKKTNLSEDDIALLLELGYENELGRIVGYENLTRLKTEHLKSTSRHDSNRYRTAFGYRGEEFTQTKKNTAAAAYREDKSQAILRTVFTLLFAALLLIMELPHGEASPLYPLQTAYPMLFQLGAMLIFFACVALSYRQVFAGLRSFFRFSPTPYSICGLAPLFVIPYDLVALFIQTPLLPVHFLFSVLFAATAICDLLRVGCEIRVLRLLSAEGEKHALTVALPRKKKLRLGNQIVKVVNDDLGKNMYRIQDTQGTVGFFRRFNTLDTAVTPIYILTLLPPALAVAIALATAIMRANAADALTAFMTVLTLSAPVSAIVTFFYPLCRANRLLSNRNCALIGEEAASELQQNTTVIFRDTDLYRVEHHTVVSMRGGEAMRGDLKLASILFRKLGGTLAHLGEDVPAVRNDPPVSIVRIQESGVEAMIENRYHVLAGDADFLKRSGVRVPKESAEKILARGTDTCAMYVAVDGVLKLFYEITYATNAETEETVLELCLAGHTAAIQSYDPCLHETFLQKSRAHRPDPVQVIKPGRFEEEKILEITDSPAISLGEKSHTVSALYAASRIGSSRRFGFRMQVIASLLAAAAYPLLLLLGMESAIGIPAILCYQLFWTLVTVIATCTELTPEKLCFSKNTPTKEKDNET